MSITVPTRSKDETDDNYTPHACQKDPMQTSKPAGRFSRPEVAFRLKSPFVAAIFIALLIATHLATASAEVVSFDTSSWNHGAGFQTGWTNGQKFGQTVIFGNQLLTISTSSVGTALPTAQHFTRINQSFFTGFAFQLRPSTTNNPSTFANYERLNFSFTTGVGLDSFTLTDVDRTNGQWWDVICAEGFTTTTPGAVGTGITAAYAFNSPTNLTIETLFGMQSVRPVAASGNVQNTPRADVTFSFANGIRSFSIYYWNYNAANSGATTQTIGIRGNQFVLSLQAVPEPGTGGLALAAILALTATRRRATSSIPGPWKPSA